MDFVERNFSVIVACVMAMNVVTWRSRMKPFVAGGRITQLEVDRFTRGATITLLLTTAAWVAIEQGLSARIQCVRLFDWSQRGSIAYCAVCVCLSVALLRWIWGWGGEFIAKVPGAFLTPSSAETEYEPLTVRLVITGLVLVVGVGTAMVGNSGSTFPGCAG